MSKRKRTIEEFFSRYESNFNAAINGDASKASDAVQPFFADCFVGSSVTGVRCSQNNDKFVDMIRQGFEFYRNIGTTGMTITSKDISMLDDQHAFAKIYWHYMYNKDGREGSIDFHTIYMLTTVNGEPRIFAYITGDEQKVLKEHGLVMEETEAS